MRDLSARPFIMLSENILSRLFTFLDFRLLLCYHWWLLNMPILSPLLVMKIWWQNERKKGSGSSYLIHSIVVKCGKRNSLFYLKDIFLYSQFEGLIVQQQPLPSNARYSFVLCCNLHSMSTMNKIKIISFEGKKKNIFVSTNIFNPFLIASAIIWKRFAAHLKCAIENHWLWWVGRRPWCSFKYNSFSKISIWIFC